MSAWERARAALGPRPSRVTVLCTGNICRSPIAEVLLSERLADLGVTDVEVGSAGTHALVGSGAMPEAVAAAHEHGGDASQHVASQLDESVAAASGLLLCATEGHRGYVLAHFGHLDAARARLFNEPIDDGDMPLDVDDPYGLDGDVYRLVGNVIARAMEAWAERIAKWPPA